MMPLPHDALVLVADGRKMLFFRNHGDENQIDLRTEAHDARIERKDREIKTDAPGTTKQSGGYGRSTYEETDFQQQEEDRWIKDAADELRARASSATISTRSPSSRRPRRSVYSRNAFTRRSSGASSAPSTRR
jgi:protein required for attachment to host cells